MSHLIKISDGYLIPVTQEQMNGTRKNYSLLSKSHNSIDDTTTENETTCENTAQTWT